MAVVALAGAALVLRRRHPRPGRNQAESDVAVKAGYAEAEPIDEFTRQASGDNLNAALVISARLSRALAAEMLVQRATGVEELSTNGASVAAVRHGRSSTTLMVQHVPLAARAKVIACLPNAATRAFGHKSDVEGMVSRDGDVLVRLTGVADQVETARRGEIAADEPEAWPTPSMLLRVGLLADRQVLATSWDAVSHLLVAAPLSHGGEAVLGALVASMVAQRSPAELGLMILGGPRALPAELQGVTHLLEAPADPHDEKAALEAISRLGEELARRVARGDRVPPDVVLVVPELGDLNAEHYAALGPILMHGPRNRIRVIAARARPVLDLVQNCPLLSEFGTRLVLRTADEEESIALLGSGDATELGPAAICSRASRVEFRCRHWATAWRPTTLFPSLQ